MKNPWTNNHSRRRIKGASIAMVLAPTQEVFYLNTLNPRRLSGVAKPASSLMQGACDAGSIGLVSRGAFALFQ